MPIVAHFASFSGSRRNSAAAEVFSTIPFFTKDVVVHSLNDSNKTNTHTVCFILIYKYNSWFQPHLDQGLAAVAATSAVAPLLDSSFVVGTGRVARAPQQTSPSKGVNLKVNEDGGNGARKMGFYDGIPFLEHVLCYVNHLG